MEALIIVAHGSKMESSNDEVLKVVEKIKNKISNENLIVLASFLESVDPSLFMAINNALSQKCEKIKIFPYFLAAGKHVTKDLPCEIKKFKKQYPDIEFELLTHFGLCNGIEDLIISNI